MLQLLLLYLNLLAFTFLLRFLLAQMFTTLWAVGHYEISKSHQVFELLFVSDFILLSQWFESFLFAVSQYIPLSSSLLQYVFLCHCLIFLSNLFCCFRIEKEIRTKWSLWLYNVIMKLRILRDHLVTFQTIVCQEKTVLFHLFHLILIPFFIYFRHFFVFRFLLISNFLPLLTNCSK